MRALIRTVCGPDARRRGPVWSAGKVRPAKAVWTNTFCRAPLDSRAQGRTASGFGWGLALVVAVAAALRLYRIHELPLGPYVDEIQTRRTALAG